MTDSASGANTASGGRAPAVFVGHGSPMNTLERNPHTQAWAAAGRAFGKPKAIVAVSAHWYIRGVAVTAMPAPATIHDFGGFPPALHAFEYPAPGDVALAERVRALLAPLDVRLDQEWGLDHGTWSVLAHMYPAADVPVVQLAIDAAQPGPYHYALGQSIATLRDEGVMIIGSGNVVHNLRAVRWSGGEPYPWALRFDETVRACIERGEHGPLLDHAALGDAAQMSVPTPDHFLPLLYVLGARRDDDRLVPITGGIELGSISMLSFALATGSP